MKVFTEEQRFNKWILVLISIMPIIGGIVPILLSEDDALNSNSDGYWGLIIVVCTMTFVTVLMLSIKLSTKINEQGVYYQFFPNQWNEKFTAWTDLEQCYLTEQNSLSKYGGYGYRRCFWGKNKGTALNVGGKYGIQLILKNGKRILIGTQKKEDVQRVLETYATKIKNNETQE